MHLDDKTKIKENKNKIGNVMSFQKTIKYQILKS